MDHNIGKKNWNISSFLQFIFINYSFQEKGQKQQNFWKKNQYFRSNNSYMDKHIDIRNLLLCNIWSCQKKKILECLSILKQYTM